MNVSGPAVHTALRKLDVPPERLVLIHDSLDHAPAAVKYRFGGSHNGHNGVRSVSSSIQTTQYHRIRVGIGRPEGSVDSYVLGRLPSFERQQLGPDGTGTDQVWAEIQKIMTQLGPRSR